MSGDAIHGRGASFNPANRFENRAYVPSEEEAPAPLRPKTVFLNDSSRSVFSHNTSPDVGFDRSINPYRGCEHGCVYCYARPTHEYLGFSSGLDFETRIMVKPDAPALLREALQSPRYVPVPLGMSGVTDPYQPVEHRRRITRGCLEVLAEFRHPVGIITKNRLVTRDIDLLSELAQHEAANVAISVTTLSVPLNRVLEPRTSLPRQRLEAIRALAEAGVPVGVMVSPVIPGLTDEEIPSLLNEAAARGARWACMTMLRLPGPVKDLFLQWLEQHYPERKEKVVNRIRSMRGGELDDPRFGHRMQGEGFFAEQLRQLFSVSRRRAGLAESAPALSVEAFRKAGGSQLELFS